MEIIKYIRKNKYYIIMNKNYIIILYGNNKIYKKK